MGEQTGEILVICFIATMYSSGMGMVVGTIGTWSTNLKNGIIVALTMACSFAADLMISGVKEAIEKYVPVINRLNPGALITDAFLQCAGLSGHGKISEKPAFAGTFRGTASWNCGFVNEENAI